MTRWACARAMILAALLAALWGGLCLLDNLKDHTMRTLATLGALIGAALMLSGCITSGLVKDLPPEAKRDLALKFIERCGGTVSIGATGSAGQLGGAVTGDFRLTGTCPTPEPAKAAPPAAEAPPT